MTPEMAKKRSKWDGSRCLREKKSVQTRENLIGEPAWEEMTRLFAPSLGRYHVENIHQARSLG